MCRGVDRGSSGGAFLSSYSLGYQDGSRSTPRGSLRACVPEGSPYVIVLPPPSVARLPLILRTMTQTSFETSQRFPFAYDSVFAGLLSVLPPLGYGVSSSDPVIGRILAAAGSSAFSWGENLAIRVSRVPGEGGGEPQCDVVIQSSLKVGSNWSASAKNSQNAERIIGALSHYLQNGGVNATESAAAAPSSTSGNGAMWALLLMFVLFGVLITVAGS